jgi:hypothetical protein
MKPMHELSISFTYWTQFKRSDIFQKEGLISPASCWMTNSAKHIANGVCEYTEELSQNSILLNKMAEDIQRKLDGKILHHEGIQSSNGGDGMIRLKGKLLVRSVPLRIS